MSRPAHDTRTRMSFLDKCIAFVSPTLALRRMAAKSALEIHFGYNDRPEQRGWSGGMYKNSSPESWAKHRDRIKAMWDAREQAEHDWIGGALAQVALYVVGSLTCKSNTGDPVLDKIYDEYLHNWAGEEESDDGYFLCDSTGRRRLRSMAQLGFIGMLVDGDHGWQWNPGSELAMPSVTAIEADRIGSPIEATQSETYVGGIVIDEGTKKPLAARIYQRSRMSNYSDPQEVPWANFFHLIDSDSRTDEYRGRSHLLRGLNINRDLRETAESESMAIKTQSQWAAVATSRNPYDQRNGAAFGSGKGATNNGTSTGGTQTQAAEWGKILTMTDGESISMLTPSARPNNATMNFWMFQIRRLAISLKLSFGFLWDLSTLGGVTARIQVRGDERRIMYWQQLLVDCFLRRVRRLLLAHGVAYGHIPAHPQMGKCTWHFGQRMITDAGYEMQNDLAAASAGIVAIDDLATKYNDHSGLEEIMRRNASAVKTAQAITVETGVPIELFARGIWPDATNQLAAIQSPPTPPPPPGSQQAVGDKGAQQIVEILKDAASGALPREEAINSLITIYGFPDDLAKEMVPEKQKQPADEGGGGKVNGHDRNGKPAGSRN